jgi:hypothetical protein
MAEEKNYNVSLEINLTGCSPLEAAKNLQRILMDDAEFYEPNGELMDSSPWSYGHIEDYLVKRFELGCWNKKKPIFKPGCVYKFNGTYTIYKNGSHSFNGKIRKINTT